METVGSVLSPLHTPLIKALLVCTKGGQETALLLSSPMDEQLKLSPADLRPSAFVLSTQTEHPQRS